MPSRAWPWSGVCSCVALAHLLASQCPQHGHMPDLCGGETKLKHIVHYARVSERGLCISSISLTEILLEMKMIGPCPRPTVSEMWRWKSAICGRSPSGLLRSSLRATVVGQVVSLFLCVMDPWAVW